MRTKNGHDTYDGTDFTQEDIDERKKDAIIVMEWGMKICRYCGAKEDELREPCRCSHSKR